MEAAAEKKRLEEEAAAEKKRVEQEKKRLEKEAAAAAAEQKRLEEEAAVAAAEMKRLEGEGFTLLNPTPKQGADNKLVCFLHPKGTNGVLIELCQEF